MRDYLKLLRHILQIQGELKERLHRLQRLTYWT